MNTKQSVPVLQERGGRCVPVETTVETSRRSDKHTKLTVMTADGLEYVEAGYAAICTIDRIITMFSSEKDVVYIFDQKTLAFKASFTVQGTHPVLAGSDDQASVITWDAPNRVVLVFQLVRGDADETRLIHFAVASDEAARDVHLVQSRQSSVRFTVMNAGCKTCVLVPNEVCLLPITPSETSDTKDTGWHLSDDIGSKRHGETKQSGATRDTSFTALTKPDIDAPDSSKSYVIEYTASDLGVCTLKHIRYSSRDAQPIRGGYFMLRCHDSQHVLRYDDLCKDGIPMMALVQTSYRYGEWIICFAPNLVLRFPTPSSRLFAVLSACFLPVFAELVMAYLYPVISDWVQSIVHDDRMWTSGLGGVFSCTDVYDDTRHRAYTIPGRTSVAGFDGNGRPILRE